MTNEEALANKIATQREGRLRWFMNYCIGTIVWATGVGKSKLAIDCIEQLRHEYLQMQGEGVIRILLVTPTEKMRDEDWPDEFIKWGCSMDGVKRICYASLAKENLEDYYLIIYDEMHKLTTPNLERLEHVLNQVKVLGLTATYPSVVFEDDFTAERVGLAQGLLPSIHTITTDEAVDLGLIQDFEVWVLKFYLDAVNKNIPAKVKAIGKAKGTVKESLITEAEQYKNLTKRIQWAIVKKLDGVKFGMISARMNFMYNLPSKLRLAKQCLDHMGLDKRTIVFAGSIDQANELCGLNKVYHSKSDGEALKQFQRKEINLIGAVRCLNEGANLTEPDQELIVQVDSQERNLVQRIGRSVRFRYDKPEHKALIVILVALNTADEQWYKKAIAGFHTKRISEKVVRVPEITSKYGPTIK